jgi:hypothetical protein
LCSRKLGFPAADLVRGGRFVLRFVLKVRVLLVGILGELR